MNSRDTLRNWIRLLFLLGQNPLTLIGAVLTTSSALTLIAFWFYDFFLPGPPHPYIGILLFLILPGIFIIGLVLIPIGILLRRRHLHSKGEIQEKYPQIDLRQPIVRHGVALVGGATLVNLLIFGTASFRGVAYMDSTQFCGQTCHTVMTPEFTAYQGSPHAHVGCVECHIGPGAGWFVQSKLSGVRQVFAVTFKTYSRPIPAPVKYLRPARETCEHCHWPQRFTGDKFVVKTTYKDDEKNTPQTTVLLMKIGGRTWQGSMGIHGRHLDNASRIQYISIDDKRQVIPVVYYTDDQGKTVEYVSSEIKTTKQQLDAGEHRAMDCVDCHNRPTHAFDLPENAVNRQMSAGVISPELPFVRKEAVELLKAEYPDRDTAKRQITEALNNFYHTKYSAVYDTRRALVQQAANGISDIYLRNIFPEMKMTWGIHVNNLGHNDSPGCFRCHDGSHTSTDGKTIANDCETCHSLLAMEEENPKVLKDIGLK
jgi:NapC/NirT cytochrome c family protein